MDNSETSRTIFAAERVVIDYWDLTIDGTNVELTDAQAGEFVRRYLKHKDIVLSDACLGKIGHI